MSISGIWFFAFVFNFTLIAIVHRIPFLTRTGWAHAGILGTILIGCLGWQGWLSVALYLLFGSLVTKIGLKQKQLKGIAEERGGRRGAKNVWGSAASGTIIAILIGAGIGSKEVLLAGFAASFAAKLADTFGSELGKTWGSKTILITNLKPVAPGTDGGISLEGTIASVVGSVLMTLAMVTLSLINSSQIILIVISAGIIATLLESVIGALFQNRFNFLSNELINFIQTTFASISAIVLAYALR